MTETLSYVQGDPSVVGSARGGDEGDVETACGDLGEQPERPLLDECDLDRRVRGVELAEGLGNQADAERRRRAQAHPAALETRELAQLAPRRRGVAQHPAGPGEQRFAGCGQRGPA